MLHTTRRSHHRIAEVDVSESSSSHTPREATSIIGWLREPRPGLVKVAIGLLSLQAFAVALYAVWGIFDLVTGLVEYLGVSIALVLAAAAVAWLLVAITRGVGDRRVWVRGPAVTVQILLILVGVSLLQAHVLSIGVPVLVFGAITFVVLCLPQVSRYIGYRELTQD